MAARDPVQPEPPVGVAHPAGGLGQGHQRVAVAGEGVQVAGDRYRAGRVTVADQQVVAGQPGGGVAPRRVALHQLGHPADAQQQLGQLLRGHPRHLADEAVLVRRRVRPDQHALRQGPALRVQRLGQGVRHQPAHAVPVERVRRAQVPVELGDQLLDQGVHPTQPGLADPPLPPGQLDRQQVHLVAQPAVPVGVRRRRPAGVVQAEQPQPAVGCRGAGQVAGQHSTIVTS